MLINVVTILQFGALLSGIVLLIFLLKAAKYNRYGFAFLGTFSALEI